MLLSVMFSLIFVLQKSILILGRTLQIRKTIYYTFRTIIYIVSYLG